MNITFTFETQSQQIANDAISIIKGDAYDDLSNPTIRFHASDDFIDGLTARLTIRQVNDLSTDPPVLEVTTVADGEDCVFTLPSSLTNSIPLAGRRQSFNYDFEIEFGPDSFKTGAMGTFTVTESETRR